MIIQSICSISALSKTCPIQDMYFKISRTFYWANRLMSCLTIAYVSVERHMHNFAFIWFLQKYHVFSNSSRPFQKVKTFLRTFFLRARLSQQQSSVRLERIKPLFLQLRVNFKYQALTGSLLVDFSALTLCSKSVESFRSTFILMIQL